MAELAADTAVQPDQPAVIKRDAQSMQQRVAQPTFCVPTADRQHSRATTA
jgi:hypothetical protein